MTLQSSSYKVFFPLGFYSSWYKDSFKDNIKETSGKWKKFSADKPFFDKEWSFGSESIYQVSILCLGRLGGLGDTGRLQHQECLGGGAGGVAHTVWGRFRGRPGGWDIPNGRIPWLDFFMQRELIKDWYLSSEKNLILSQHQDKGKC